MPMRSLHSDGEDIVFLYKTLFGSRDTLHLWGNLNYDQRDEIKYAL